MINKPFFSLIFVLLIAVVGCAQKQVTCHLPMRPMRPDPISFKSCQAVPTQESVPLLENTASILKENPKIRVKILGHLDSWENRHCSLKKLDLLRAETVKKNLIHQGIDPSRLETGGYLETRPLAPNQTPEGRAQNRRVEFSVLDD